MVQLNGAANTRTSGIEYASDLISSFGSAFDAAVHHFPVPAFFDFPDTKAAMWRERSVRRVLDVQRRADIALFSVGAVAGAVPSHVYSAGYLDDADIEMLHREGVVGDVCTVFLRADGSYADVALNARATGPTPAELHRVPRRVCVVAGDNKVVPLLAALRCGRGDGPRGRRADRVAAARRRVGRAAWRARRRGRRRGSRAEPRGGRRVWRRRLWPSRRHGGRRTGASSGADSVGGCPERP